MIVVGEQRTEHTVDEARGEYLVVGSATLTLEESAGITTERCIFFFILYLKGHKVDSFAGLLSGNDSGEEHGVAHAQLYRSIGLLGKLACFEGDLTTVGQGDGFLDWI